MMTDVGTCFLAGFDGDVLPDPIRSLLRDEQLAGIVLFRRNITSFAQLRALTDSARAAAGRPILVAVDHEGGRVFRMPKPFTPIPPMAVLGQRGDPALAFAVGQLMGRELAAAGITVNFAPVLDINTNPLNPIIGDRAFSGDRDRVVALGCALIRGLLDAGVAPCGKHFPGHGDTSIDSHLGLPESPHTWERLRQFELRPFQAAIAAGVPMVMTAHVVYGAIDAAQPATLSKRAITGLLREELAFPGVIATDDLHMGALRAFGGPAEAAVQSLAAGCDLVLICRDPEVTRAAITRVRAAVSSGELAAARIAQSAARVHALAERFAPSAPNAACVGCKVHRHLVRQLPVSCHDAASPH